MGVIVVIIGWLNVGKFILFNCLVGKCLVFVDDMFGVIWDCRFGEVWFGDFCFMIVDIVGFEEVDRFMLEGCMCC